jgi:N-methylhydantoinase B
MGADGVGVTDNLGPKPGAFLFRNTDVFAVTWQGGGGIGDPLDRLPAEVAVDVRHGIVSAEAARDVYGVVLTDSDEDGRPGWLAGETRRLRREARAVRLGQPADEVPDCEDNLDPAARPAGAKEGEGWLPLSDRLRAIRDSQGDWRVETAAGAVLCTGSTRWRSGAIALALLLPPRVGATLHEHLAVTGWLCPVSGHLLAVDVHLKDEGPFDDVDLDLSGDCRAVGLLAH